MPRTILILLTVLTAIGVQAEWLSLAGHVPPHMVQYEPADNESTPKINLTFGNDSTSLTFDLRIPFAEITSDTLFPGTFFWNIPGFYPSDIAGTPSLPVRTAMFVLPKNAENISLTENHTDWISINGYLPTPARPAKYDYDVYSISNVPSITRFDNKDAARISKIEHTNSQTIVHVTLSPVYYSGITDVVEACRELNYTLSFSYGNSAQASMRSNHMAPKSVKVEYACEVHMKPSSYVIITTPPYESSIKSYANWKRRFGHEVYILSKDSWTPKEIKDSVSAVYHRTESLDYAIFAGPYKDIPAMISPTYYYKPDESSPNGEMRTDFYYACVNGDNDKTPSIHTGRFIADNVEEMENIIRKEMLYYNTGANTPGFYNNAAHVSRFEVSSYNGSDKTVTTSPFIKTSEALRNHVIANNIHVSRIYDADDGAKPKYWIKNGVKELMPQELQYGNFPWTANTNDVVEAFNDGNFYIMYMAHGALSGWGQPSFGYQDFSRLNNQDALPIVFSMTCNTGNFVSEDGFARHILANDNGGARTVIASERPSFMNYNDAIAIGMFNTLWQTPKIDSDIVNIDKLVIIPIDPSILKSGINYIEQKTIGNILSTGKIWMNHMSSPGQGMIQEHCEMYHIFGDPGMLMNTKPPTAYTLSLIHI